MKTLTSIQAAEITYDANNKFVNNTYDEYSFNSIMNEIASAAHKGKSTVTVTATTVNIWELKDLGYKVDLDMFEASGMIDISWV